MATERHTVRLLRGWAVGLVALWLLFGWSLCAEAQEAPSVQLCWQPPTHNEDGSVLTDLSSYNVYQSLTSGDYGTPTPLTDPALTCYTVEGLQPATTYFFVMTALNSKGQESVFSNETSATTAGLPPMPPGDLVTTTETIVYSVQKSRNRLALVPFGTVPAGTPCDETQSVNGLYVIDVAIVDWASSARSEVVVGACF